VTRRRGVRSAIGIPKSEIPNPKSEDALLLSLSVDIPAIRYTQRIVFLQGPERDPVRHVPYGVRDDNVAAYFAIAWRKGDQLANQVEGWPGDKRRAFDRPPDETRNANDGRRFDNLFRVYFDGPLGAT
jgi:hypothetical protein